MQTIGNRTRVNRSLVVAGLGAALTSAVLAIAVGGRAGFWEAAGGPATHSSGSTSLVQTDTPARSAPAFRMTYYLAGSEEQAAGVQKEIDDGVAEAAATGAPVAPSQVVVVHSVEEQAVFEAGIDECGSVPGCDRSSANVVDLRGER